MIKIYVHHEYNYQLFWYFFHGCKISPKDVPTSFNKTMVNRNLGLSDVNIKTKYKSTELDILFCDSKHWDKDDGYHIFDITTWSLQQNITSEVGLIVNVLDLFKDIKLKELRKVKEPIRKKTYIGWISWEGFSISDKNIGLESLHYLGYNFYTDTLEPIDESKFVLSQMIYSFIFSDKTYMREYYLFHKWLKEKKSFGYKLLYPIRRIYDSKLYIAEKIQALKNKSFGITLSSYSDSNQFENKKEYELILDEFKSKIKYTTLDKRGYGYDDFGGEWMVNNMQEQLFELFFLSEINLMHENKFSNCFSEKTMCHIFAGKPFLDVHYSTIEKLKNLVESNGVKLPKYPLKQYDDITDVLEYLDTISKDSKKWKKFISELNIWIDTVRNFFIEYTKKNNSLMDIIIKTRKVL